MTLDDLIERLIELRKAAGGASIAPVHVNIYASVMFAEPMNITEPAERVFYQGGAIVIVGRGVSL